MHGARFWGLQGNQSAASGACMSVARSLPGNLLLNPEGQESFANAGRGGESCCCCCCCSRKISCGDGGVPLPCCATTHVPLFYHCCAHHALSLAFRGLVPSLGGCDFQPWVGVISTFQLLRSHFFFAFLPLQLHCLPFRLQSILWLLGTCQFCLSQFFGELWFFRRRLWHTVFSAMYL
jgi:hypothetical protein